MKSLALFLSLVYSIIFVQPLVAENSSDHKSISSRQKNQRKRIRQGVKSGKLTKKEAHRLKKQQKKIHKLKKKALANDGKIDRKERRKIRKRQKKASRTLYRTKHDKLRVKRKKR